MSRTWPWLALLSALALATAPIWRMIVLGTDPTLEDLLNIRCGLW